MAGFAVGLLARCERVVCDAPPVCGELGESARLTSGSEIAHAPCLQRTAALGLDSEELLVSVHLGLTRRLGQSRRPVFRHRQVDRQIHTAADRVLSRGHGCAFHIRMESLNARRKQLSMLRASEARQSYLRPGSPKRLCTRLVKAQVRLPVPNRAREEQGRSY